MMLFKNFRIRRYLCERGCNKPSVILVRMKTGGYEGRRRYCADHEHIGVYWASRIAGAKVYRDTGARSCTR